MQSTGFDINQLLSTLGFPTGSGVVSLPPVQDGSQQVAGGAPFAAILAEVVDDILGGAQVPRLDQVIPKFGATQESGSFLPQSPVKESRVRDEKVETGQPRASVRLRQGHSIPAGGVAQSATFASLPISGNRMPEVIDPVPAGWGADHGESVPSTSKPSAQTAGPRTEALGLPRFGDALGRSIVTAINEPVVETLPYPTNTSGKGDLPLTETSTAPPVNPLVDTDSKTGQTAESKPVIATPDPVSPMPGTAEGEQNEVAPKPANPMAGTLPQNLMSSIDQASGTSSQGDRGTVNQPNARQVAEATLSQDHRSVAMPSDRVTAGQQTATVKQTLNETLPTDMRSAQRSNETSGIAAEKAAVIDKPMASPQQPEPSTVTSRSSYADNLKGFPQQPGSSEVVTPPRDSDTPAVLSQRPVDRPLREVESPRQDARPSEPTISSLPVVDAEKRGGEIRTSPSEKRTPAPSTVVSSQVGPERVSEFVFAAVRAGSESNKSSSASRATTTRSFSEGFTPRQSAQAAYTGQGTAASSDRPVAAERLVSQQPTAPEPAPRSQDGTGILRQQQRPTMETGTSVYTAEVTQESSATEGRPSVPLTNEKQVVQQRPQILDQLPQVRVRHQAANQEQPELNKNAESPPARAQAQASRSGERLSSLAPLFAGTSVEKVTLKTAEKPQNATRTRSGSARPNAEIATSKSPKRPPQVEPQATKPQTTEARTSSSDREAVVSKPSSASQESGVPGTMTSRTPSPVKSATNAPPMQRMAEAVLDQVTRGLRVSLDQARSEVTLQLKPESLGTIRMRLSVENGAVQAMIQVENAEIRKIIESGLTRLGERLAEQGYRLDRSHVTVETLPVERQTATWSPRDEQPSFGRQHQQEQQQSQGRNAPWQEPRRRHPEQRFELYG